MAENDLNFDCLSPENATASAAPAGCGGGKRANYNKMESLPYISNIPCSKLQGASILDSDSWLLNFKFRNPQFYSSLYAPCPLLNYSIGKTL